MNEPLSEKTSDALLALGGLALQFTTIKRSTFLKDGKTHESDTDHTVMLGLLACALAAESDSTLDIGKIAQFALVHDLVEAYAGDTDTFTFKMTNEVHKQDKMVRESAALARIKLEFDETLPWISKTIEEYESLESPEARFVKTLDKTTPKITRWHNNDAMNTRPEDFDSHCASQLEILSASYGKDQAAARSFYEYMMKKVSTLLHSKKQ